jgi:hypothetical protein
MNTQKSVTLFFATLALVGICQPTASAQDHPQEVLDLIGSYEALAMKVRPLQDRVLTASPATDTSTGFRPEGVPLRAQAATATTGDNSAAESRVSERLRHRDRAIGADDDYKRITSELSVLERNARSELQRIRTPGFGTVRESGSVRFGDGIRGARPPSGVQAPQVDQRAIGAARRTLAELERKYAALEREVNEMQRR